MKANLHGCIDIVLEACKRCEGIISGLLSFIRKYEVQLGPVSVQDASASAVKLAEHSVIINSLGLRRSALD